MAMDVWDPIIVPGNKRWWYSEDKLLAVTTDESGMYEVFGRANVDDELEPLYVTRRWPSVQDVRDRWEFHAKRAGR